MSIQKIPRSLLVARFLKICTTEDASARVPSRDMYEVFACWCRKNEYICLTSHMFGKTMREQGRPSIHGRNWNYYPGLCIVDYE